MVLQYTLLPDILTDSEHQRLDRVVVEEHTRYLAIYELTPSHPVAVAKLHFACHLFASIVKHSNGLLADYVPSISGVMMEDDVTSMIMKGNNSREDWEEFLKKAWDERSFRDLRNMDILRAESQSSGESTSSSMNEAAFLQEYRGNVPELFLEYLKDSFERFQRKFPDSYYGNFISILQSSGTGKSRLMLEMGKFDNIIVLYMNLHPSHDQSGDTVFPLRDEVPATILTDDLPTEEEYHIRCCMFFAAIFQLLEEEFRPLIQKKKQATRAIHAWNAKMRDFSINSVHRRFFFSKLKAKYNRACSRFGYLERFGSKGFESGDSDYRHGNTKRRRVGDHGENRFIIPPDQLSLIRQRVEDLVIKAHSSVHQTLSGHVKDPQVIIAIDDAHSLTAMHECPSPNTVDEPSLPTLPPYRPSDTVCRVISTYSGSDYWSHTRVVFASTTSEILAFSPPKYTGENLNSIRRPIQGRLLLPHYTALGWGQNALPMSHVSVEGVASFSYISSFGRPLWYNRPENDPRQVLTLASAKLLSSTEFDPNVDDQALAVLGQRFALQVTFGHLDANEFLERSVANHLRVCYKATDDHTWRFTGYPCEPLWSCVAANLLHESPEKLITALRRLAQKVKNGLIEKGERGRLSSRLLWLLSKDLYLRLKGSLDLLAIPTTKRTTRNTGTNTMESKLVDCDMVPVVDWLEFVFGHGFWKKDTSGKARKVFNNAYVNFSHWLCMEANIAGTEAKPGMLIDEWSLHLWHKTSAIQCSQYQKLVDKVIPVYFKGKKYGTSDHKLMSQIFISDNAKSTPSKDDLPRITRTLMARRKNEQGNPFPGPPYIVILADLGLTSSEVTVRFEDVNEEETKCLRIYAAGIDTGVYPFLAMRPQIDEVLRDLARQPQAPMLQPTEVHELIEDMRYCSTSTPK